MNDVLGKSLRGIMLLQTRIFNATYMAEQILKGIRGKTVRQVENQLTELIKYLKDSK